MVVDMAWGITYDLKPRELNTCEGLDKFNKQRNNAKCTQKRNWLNKLIYDRYVSLGSYRVEEWQLENCLGLEQFYDSLKNKEF